MYKSERFHTLGDAELFYRAARTFEANETKHFIVQRRDLSYRFYLHQHPHVQALVQRLLRKGTKGLQAADTEYNTRIKLTSATAAKDSFGRSVQLAAGESVYLADDATATMDGSPIRFWSGRVLKLADGSTATPAANNAVTIPRATAVRRSAGDVVTMDASAAATLVDGVPVPVLHSDLFTAAQYNPDEIVQRPYPVKDLDFTPGGAYAVYNWELFFHVPLSIAIHLSKNQRFAEAQRWFHYLFDPTDDSDGPAPDRFWKVREFQRTDVRKIEEILVNLATGAHAELRKETVRSIEAWRDAPFRPHVIARYRQQAYMYKTVMAYLDNLIAWGDSLFRQDTGEAIDEALQLYVLAANILGPRPLPVPKKGRVRPQNYANLREDLAQFGTVMREIEADVPFDLLPMAADGKGENERLATLRSLGKALYFCVPRNDTLLGYWDTVADRLFKIRNSLNIQGSFRQLALFEPPIDPAMLARAAAAGLDVGAIVNGLNQPLPLVRFAFLVQKASEIVQEVKSLGSSLLSAMEKADGEAMTLLRAKHERVVMEMVEHVKYGQLQEAIKSREALRKTMDLAVQRLAYYERQLGRIDDIQKAIPVLSELDKDSLDRMKFAMDETGLGFRDLKVDIAQDLGGSGGKVVSNHEAEELSKLALARRFQEVVEALEIIGSHLAILPDTSMSISPWGVGFSATAAGGTSLSKKISAHASIFRAISSKFTHEAGNAAKIGSYARREQDWAFQSNLAAGEINQLLTQQRAAQIREAVAELELKNHRKQVEHAKEIERFLNEEGTEKSGKGTNKALYAWMKREVKGLYAQCFQFAFDIAKKAERALQHELGNPELSYLQFGYLAGKEGLLAGEKLYLDLKRMEMAFHEQNQREYELTKHVSLLQVNPMGLIELRTTGRCTMRLPESLFDMDGPGHYFRRIKTLAVSIPCVTGPYATVSCRLTLLKSSIRKTSVVGDQYGRIDGEDDRFSDHFGSLQSIVTSSAQNDSGLFETNLRDERYLPFENSGVVSEWQLQLPANPSRKEPAQFDYDTISDVILHLRYTAREGGDPLRSGALASLTTALREATAAGSVRLFSVRHEFPSDWAKFLSQKPAAKQRYELALTLRPEHYPFWSKGCLNRVKRLKIVARSEETQVNVYDRVNDTPQKAKQDTLTKDVVLDNLLVGELTGGQSGIALPPKPDEEVKLYFDAPTLSDLWIAVTWAA